MQQALAISRVWAVRRALSVADREQLSRLEGLLAIEEPQSQEATFEFDADFIHALQERFIVPLENKDMFPYPEVLATYRASLDAGVVEAM